jgi:hypothetical protein
MRGAVPADSDSRSATSTIRACSLCSWARWIAANSLDTLDLLHDVGNGTPVVIPNGVGSDAEDECDGLPAESGLAQPDDLELLGRAHTHRQLLELSPGE